MATTPPEIPGLTEWRRLARGGFALVWEARQESLNRLVAVKVDERTLDSATERQRFLREAGAAGRMSAHPGIVTVHDAGILADGRPFLVMELCPGGSLNTWLKTPERPAPARVRDVGVRIADALAAAHAIGVLHRDVKPPNILIDAYDQVGLADFGLAALPDPGMELSETLEAITPAYAPPETFHQQPPTQFGDVYSLAATLYALLKGRPPHGLVDEKPTIATALQRLDESIEPIPGVDPAFMALLLEAMSPEPGDRPTAAQFRDRLRALDLGGEVSRSAPVSSASPAASSSALSSEVPVTPARRSRLPILVAAAAAALVIALLVTTLTLTGRAPTAAPVPATPVAATGSTSPAATPTPSPPLQVVGFIDCSAALGAGALCAAEPECWGGVFSYEDAPTVATQQDCRKPHVYQTFAGAQLDFQVRRQSQIDKLGQVRRLCRADVVNAMLKPADRRDNWEIFALPPQAENESDNAFRCIFGRGEREGRIALKPPD